MNYLDDFNVSPEDIVKKKVSQIRRYNRKLRKLDRKKRLQQLENNPTYAVYITSRKWRTRKKRFYAKYGDKCFACGSRSQTTVHHISYRHLGNEGDGELAILCWNCHKEYHDIYGVKFENFETHIFIEEKRQITELAKITKYF